MKSLQLLLLAVFCVSCASAHLKTAKKYSLPLKTEIKSVPFIAQTEFMCGPASLAMMMRHLGKEVKAEDLAPSLYTPGKKGTLQADLKGTIRRLGQLGIPVRNFTDLLREVNAGHPVLIFQNLGLSWYPVWHYAVVIGYDLETKELIMHSGENANLRFKISTFERTWNRAGSWGMMVLPAGSLPVTANELDMVKASAGIEQTGYLKQAKKSYLKILKKWPDSLGALVGLGNIHYQLNELKASQKYFKLAIEKHPGSAGAKHNLSVIKSLIFKKF